MAADSGLDLDRIRKQAEERAKNRPLPVPSTDPKENLRLMEELYVHQIELEIQNEELLRVQDELERARIKFRDLYNTAPVGYLILDPVGFILEANQTFARMVNQPVADIVGRPFNRYLTEASASAFLGVYKTFFQNPADRQVHLQLAGTEPEGCFVCLHGSREPVADERQEGEAIRVAVTDITPQKKAERSLAESYRWRKLRHTIADIMLHHDGDEMLERILGSFCTSFFRSRFGFACYLDAEGEVGSKAVLDSVPPPPDGHPVTAWCMFLQEKLGTRHAMRCNEGLVLPEEKVALNNALAVSIVNQKIVIGIIAVGGCAADYSREDQARLETVADWIAPVIHARLERDRQIEITRKVEEDLRQAQKLESIGVLAGGIAHDFNNLLTPIIGYTDIMLEDCGKQDAACENLREISTAAHRARDLVGQLLAFSRKQMLDFQTIEINTAIRGIVTMLRRLIREDIVIEPALEEEELFVRGDPGQIDQVLMNLTVNAQDAMPRGGEIRIHTALRRFAAPAFTQDTRIPAGEYVLLAVTDTGTGIAPDVLPKVFDPFFTTKEVGQGTGMGLATVYGIVKQHGGYVWAESDPGAGTVINILYPRIPEPAAEDRAGSAPAARPKTHPGKTVLLVEDDSGVRRVITEALTRAGYNVIAFESPARCLEGIRTVTQDIDVLLSDVVMPGCDGQELLLKIQDRIPRARVLFMTGYDRDIIQDREIDHRNVRFLQKPFTIHNLLDHIQRSLDGAD